MISLYKVTICSGFSSLLGSCVKSSIIWPTQRRLLRRKRAKARNLWHLYVKGHLVLSSAQLAWIHHQLQAHHSRDPRFLQRIQEAMAASSSSAWTPEPWWCHCGRTNRKKMEFCGACGDHWSSTTEVGTPRRVHMPKSPRQRPQTPKPPKPKKPKQPQHYGNEGKSGGKGGRKGKGKQPAPPAPPYPFMGKGGIPDPHWPPGVWEQQWPTVGGIQNPAPIPAQNVVPPLPPPQELDPQVKQLVSQLKQMSDTLPTHVQNLLTEVGTKSDQMDSKMLHSAVARLDKAKKNLAALRWTRMQMYGAWTSFLNEATQKWSGHVKDFGAQDADLQEKISQAREMLSQARENLRQSKDKVVGSDKAEELSEDEPMLKEDAGKGITESLQQMASSLSDLKNKAENALAEDMQRASKIARLGDSEEAPQASAALGATSPSMAPFAGAGRGA